jgi:penicillin amidase
VPSDAQRAAVLRSLRGESADDVARSVGVSPETLARWTRAYFQSKLPHGPGTFEETIGLVGATVQIRRDTWGISHIRATSEADLFFGLGYAMAQDRLWQLDFQRRLVRGELAAVLGQRLLASDREMRILGLGEIADRAWATASDDVRAVLQALAAGIDRWTEQIGARLPVEFEVLGYAPRRWDPADSIAIWKHRNWYNSGRPDLIVLAELARQVLPAELADAFSGVELADETIVNPSEHHSHDPDLAPPDGHGAGALDEGSNNWVVGGARTTTDAPVLCSDPHNPFAAPSQWFEAQLTCPRFDAAGAVYIGTPVLYLGRNQDVAWGLTNHAISVRDLYREEIDPARPDHYRHGNHWRPFEATSHQIVVADAPTETLVVRRTVRGPLVNDILPRVSVTEAPLGLRWIGAETGSGLEASLGLIRASSAVDVVDALRQWPVPPLNFVYADRGGDFGYHVAGLVPIRQRAGERIRQANDPDDAWKGTYAFDDLPNVANPPRDWVATANNVPWSRDAWYLETGDWSDGYRARRIRERLTAKETFAPEEVAAVHADVYSIRARDLIPPLLEILRPVSQPLAREATAILRRWDDELTVGSVGASIWTAFWTQWCLAVARARFPASIVEFAATKSGGVARRLLLGENLTWFEPPTSTVDEIQECFVAAVEALERWGGGNPRSWQWGKLHQVTHPHPMSHTPELQRLFDTGPFPTSGGSTVRAAGHDYRPPFAAVSGSTYRFMADLSQPDRMISVQTIGQSAHLGSPHYRDQAALWLANEYHPLWMDEADVLAHLESETIIQPLA